jgi:hypothetical protein
VEDTELAANVRNMVYVGSDDLTDFNEKAFLHGIRSGNLYGTNGPLLTVSLNDTPMGGLASGEVQTIKLKVDAADWMSVDHYTVYVNGEVAGEGAVTAGEFQDIPLDLTTDAFVNLEVTGPTTDLSEEVIGATPPFAFTNPIYFDADNDGKWTPIGTPLPARPQPVE